MFVGVKTTTSLSVQSWTILDWCFSATCTGRISRQPLKIRRSWTFFYISLDGLIFWLNHTKFSVMLVCVVQTILYWPLERVPGRSIWQSLYQLEIDLIARTLTAIFGEDVVLNQLELTIFSHIECYVWEMDTSKAHLFQKCVTDCETLQQPISVIFNSMENEQQILQKPILVRSHCLGSPRNIVGIVPRRTILSGSQSKSIFQFVW